LIQKTVVIPIERLKKTVNLCRISMTTHYWLKY